MQRYKFNMEHKDTKTQRFLNFWFFNIFFVTLCLCVQELSTKESTKGFFDLADGVEGDVVFLGINTLEVVLGDDHIREAQLLSLGNPLLDAIDRTYLT